MRIDFSNVNGAVAKHFLNVADVYICFQQAGGEGVPEHMGRDMHLDCCQGTVSIYHSPNGLVG